ncbi:MAG TPA: hypothetical protein VLH84_00115 [Patescibacteria group bacterium]|nr:hypothetical protein [Patescibacteria group bacterium]
MGELIMDMHRPVLNFTQSNADALSAEATRMGIDPDHLRMLGCATSRVAILGSGELRGFLDYIEVDKDTADLDGLVEHLETHMPASVDDVLDVPSYPFGVHWPLGRKPHKRLFTLGTDTPTVHKERAAARSLTEEFFGVAGEDLPEAWPDWDYMAEMWLARLNSPDAVAAFSELLRTRPELVPSTIKLGEVALDDGKD